jgi:hypothetical protein
MCGAEVPASLAVGTATVSDNDHGALCADVQEVL